MKLILRFCAVTVIFACLSLVAPVQAQEDHEAVKLFSGSNLDDWKPLFEKSAWMTAGGISLDENNKKRFSIQDGEGVMVNGPRGNTSNLISKFEHGDCEMHIEFVVPEGSNSGIYFQGLYEIQILDSFGKDVVEFSDCGGIYARYNRQTDQTYEGHPPRVNASKAPGEWQSFDVVFRAPRFNENGEKVENARFIRVEHNGKTIHENVDVTGPTRASLEEFGKKKEEPNDGTKMTGPIMLQGDHGPVAFRNITIKPLSLD